MCCEVCETHRRMWVELTGIPCLKYLAMDCIHFSSHHVHTLHESHDTRINHIYLKMICPLIHNPSGTGSQQSKTATRLMMLFCHSALVFSMVGTLASSAIRLGPASPSSTLRRAAKTQCGDFLMTKSYYQLVCYSIPRTRC